MTLPVTARVVTTLVVVCTSATLISVPIAFSISIVISTSIIVRTRPLFPFFLPLLFFFIAGFLALILETDN